MPDTKDVQDTFGVVVQTLKHQEEQINNLQDALKKITQENIDNQNQSIVWTAKCIEQLNQQNFLLQQKLKDANLQMKNLSYNIQGYVDESMGDTANEEEEELELLDLEPPVFHLPKFAG